MLIHRVQDIHKKFENKIMKSRIILPFYIFFFSFNTPHAKTRIAAQDALRGY